MKLVLKIVGVVVGLFVALMVLQMVASESGEVVVVESTTSDGATTTTRLWVVDHDGAMWLRSGSPMSGWYQRMQADPAIVVTRNDVAVPYTAVPEVAMRDVINVKLNEKYGWADDFIALMFGRDDAIPIRLQPR